MSAQAATKPEASTGSPEAEPERIAQLDQHEVVVNAVNRGPWLAAVAVD